MKHIINKWEQNVYNSKVWDFYFSGLKIGVLDIETTGLNPIRDKFILGCLYDVNAGEFHQILAQNTAEEPIALAEYAKLLAGVDMVVTYNGVGFDVPFIARRLKASNSAINYLMREQNLAGQEASSIYNLDLYKVLNKHSSLRKLLPNLKQKTVENYMGLWDSRADEISGAESVELYYHYEASGDPEAEAKIFLHNSDDVRQLTKLTEAVAKSDFHKAMYNMGFPLKLEGHMFAIEKIKLSRNELKFSGFCYQTSPHIEYMGFSYRDWPVNIEFHSGRFEFRIPAITESNMTMLDLRGLLKNSEAFELYPSCGSGFLVIAEKENIRYREVNHFIKVLMKEFMEDEL